MAKKHNISFEEKMKYVERREFGRKGWTEKKRWKRRNVLDMEDIWCEKETENEKSRNGDTLGPVELIL